ncbi:hypothetical protein [Aestuariivirga litoralis]|uniref:hypothetical protein n=1 Tax=Aestuariivirga litoralis TaxID=2650924 RepID=UPI0018C61DCF|nr:hypothetical protein [Aestuariivirga litoralis]MBG1231965.1 hypothetical protein [Aestuariivirga litoralis]
MAQATPLLAQEREWSLNTTDTQTFLVFGVPDTDDVGLSFWCEPGKPGMSAFLPEPNLKLKRGQKLPMKILTNGKTTTLPASADKDDASGLFTVEGKFTQKSSLVQDLRKGDAVTVTVLTHSSTYPLTDADFDGFIESCNGIAQPDN